MLDAKQSIQQQQQRQQQQQQQQPRAARAQGILSAILKIWKLDFAPFEISIT